MQSLLNLCLNNIESYDTDLPYLMFKKQETIQYILNMKFTKILKIITIIPTRAINDTNIIKKIFKKYEDELELIEKNGDILNAVKSIIQREINDEIKKIVVNNINYHNFLFYYNNLPKEFFSHDVIKSIIKSIYNYPIFDYHTFSFLSDILPVELLNEEILKIIIVEFNNFYKKKGNPVEFFNLHLFRQFYDDLKEKIPQNLLSVEIIKFIIEQSGGINLGIIMVIIPEKILNDEIINFLIDKCAQNYSNCIMRKIPVKFLNKENVMKIINKSYQLNFIIPDIPLELLDSKIIMTIINKHKKEYSEYMIKCIPDYMLKHIPKNLYNNEIVMALIDTIYEGYMPYLTKYIPKELLTDKIIELIISKSKPDNIFNAIDGGYIQCLTKHIPKELLTDKIIELIISKSEPDNIYYIIDFVMTRIPKELLNHKIIKLFINKYTHKNINWLTKYIPLDLLDDEIKELIKKK